MGLEVVLQDLDLAGQHRLRDVQRLGRASEVQMLSDRDEVAQLPQVNVHHDLLPTLIPTEYYKRWDGSWTRASAGVGLEYPIWA
jgi:hypothetical protein